MSEARFRVTAVAPIGHVPIPVSRFRRWWLRLRRRPLPQRPIYPPDTHALAFDTTAVGGGKVRICLPAVRIEPDQ